MSPATLEGTSLGKYRVLEPLGRGGMAQVYKAYHAQLDRYVAIKVLRSDLVEQEEFLGRFRREARAASGLRHPNIVQVFDFDVQDDLYYMVMELLEGDTLRARLNEYRIKGQRMPLPEVVRILKDVLSGLAYAHSEGIIHRDIKPANIMLTRRGQAVLTDFGIAQIIGSTQYTVSGALMGTLNYMAPEQGLQGHCDSRSDIYSLGIVFYEMLTGYTPFDADTPLAILMKHLNDPLPLPHLMDPTVPEALERIALKALAKNPEDRYQTPEEMSVALQQAAEAGLPSDQRPAIPPPVGIDPRAAFSGTSRDQITDHRFADQDTDPYLSALRADSATRPPTGPVSVAPKGSPIERYLVENRPSVVTAVFGTLGLFMIVNFLAAVLSTMTTISPYRYGWAFEILLASTFFFLLAWSLENAWLFVPGIIIFGNAVILAFCAITGLWHFWGFLWMLEPLIVFAAVGLPLRLYRRNPSQAPAWARNAGALMAALSVALAGSTCILAIVASLMRP
jgi:serine/threonine protein kinase